MNNIVCINIESGTIFMNYISNNYEIFTHNFDLISNESKKVLFKTLLKHYKVPILIFPDNIKILKKHGWL